MKKYKISILMICSLLLSFQVFLKSLHSQNASIHNMEKDLLRSQKQVVHIKKKVLTQNNQQNQTNLSTLIQKNQIHATITDRFIILTAPNPDQKLQDLTVILAKAAASIHKVRISHTGYDLNINITAKGNTP